MLHKSQEESEEKSLAMTTGFNMLRPYVNFANTGLLLAHGRPGQRALRCRRQALFPHLLLAVLICLNFKVKGEKLVINLQI